MSGIGTFHKVVYDVVVFKTKYQNKLLSLRSTEWKSTLITICNLFPVGLLDLFAKKERRKLDCHQLSLVVQLGSRDMTSHLQRHKRM